MKKIIILLFLSTLVKAQIVQPKSTTTFSNVRATGSMTVASKLRVGSTVAPSSTLDVTGTMSISGTSTLTGAAKQTNTLNYEGNTTWNTNQTNTLTTGNTGTVAVLSDAVFPVYLSAGATSFVDGVTYYCGNFGFSNQTLSSGGVVTLPYNCTLIGYNYNWVITTTLASSETATLSVRVDNTTDVQLSTAITYTAADFYDEFQSLALNTNFTAGNKINIKLQCPSYTTNPVGVYQGVTLWFVRRQ